MRADRRPNLVASLPRDEGIERLTVSELDAGIELAVERRTLEGWRVGRRITIRRDELARVVSALLMGIRGAPADRTASSR